MEHPVKGGALMAYLCRCPVCRYPKRIDRNDIAECGNAECASVFVPIASVAVPVIALWQSPNGRRFVFQGFKPLVELYTSVGVGVDHIGAGARRL